MNEFDEYQKNVMHILQPMDLDDIGQLMQLALGLCSEAGEVADLIIKHNKDHRQIDKDEAVSELGDCMWYVAALCNKLSIPLQWVADANIIKLYERHGLHSPEAIEEHHANRSG